MYLGCLFREDESRYVEEELYNDPEVRAWLAVEEEISCNEEGCGSDSSMGQRSPSKEVSKGQNSILRSM